MAQGCIETDTSPEMILHILLSKISITSEQLHDKEPNKTLSIQYLQILGSLLQTGAQESLQEQKVTVAVSGFPASSRTQELLYESQCNLRKCLL